jgi:hypothetical protein
MQQPAAEQPQPAPSLALASSLAIASPLQPQPQGIIAAAPEKPAAPAAAPLSPPRAVLKKAEAPSPSRRNDPGEQLFGDDGSDSNSDSGGGDGPGPEQLFGDIGGHLGHSGMESESGSD